MLKQFILNTRYDFTKHVRPKWKYFLHTVSVLSIVDFIFYALTNSPVQITTMDHKIIYTFVALFNIAFVYVNFREYVGKDYLRLKKEMMQTYLNEVILKDEQMSRLYNGVSENRKDDVVSILFDIAILEKSKSN